MIVLNKNENQNENEKGMFLNSGVAFFIFTFILIPPLSFCPLADITYKVFVIPVTDPNLLTFQKTEQYIHSQPNEFDRS